MSNNYLTTDKELFGDGSESAKLLTTAFVSSDTFRVGDHDSIILVTTLSGLASTTVHLKIEVSFDGGTSYQEIDNLDDYQLDGSESTHIDQFNVFPYGLYKVSVKRTGGDATTAALCKGTARRAQSGRIPQPVYLTSIQGVPGSFDEVSQAATVLDAEHAAIHAGVHYTCQDYDNDVDITPPKYWHVIAPDSTVRAHLNFRVNASRPGVVEFFESPTTTDDGTALTVYNNERNSANTSTVTFFSDPAVSVDGSRILVESVGSDAATGPVGGAGGADKRSQEFVLKQDTAYLVKFTTTTDDSRVSCAFELYEAS